MQSRNRGLVAALSAAALVGAQQAHADLPAAVATTVTEVTADITEAGGLIIGLVLVVMSFAWIKKVLRG